MEVAKQDSDFAYFFALLVTGEVIIKLVALMTTSALATEKDRHQYRILHGLVRANGIGDWSKAIDDLFTGTASQHLSVDYRVFQAEITKKVSEGDWQHTAVQEMVEALKQTGIDVELSSGKKDLKSWFRLFTELRNKTRGHGALRPDSASKAAPYLQKSTLLILDNLSLFNLPTAYLKRNLSGKYRVTSIGNPSDKFDSVKSTSSLHLADGIYIHTDELKKVPLILSDPDLTDFFISNGGFSNKKYELLSYITDDKKHGDSSEFLNPIGELPPSESEGLGELRGEGNCFTNAPALSYDYIERQELEDQLFSLLQDDRRTVVTLLGMRRNRQNIPSTSCPSKAL